MLQRRRSASRQVFTCPRVLGIGPRALQRLRRASRQVFTCPRVLEIGPRVLQMFGSTSQMFKNERGRQFPQSFRILCPASVSSQPLHPSLPPEPPASVAKALQAKNVGRECSKQSLLSEKAARECYRSFLLFFFEEGIPKSSPRVLQNTLQDTKCSICTFLEKFYAVQGGNLRLPPENMLHLPANFAPEHS